MAKKLFLLLIAAAFIFSVNINAQESKKKNKDKDNDEENFWSNWGKSKWLDWRLRGNPFIELDYGFLQPGHNSFNTKFNQIGLGEVKLGYRDMNEGREDYILKMKENSVYGSWIKSDFSSTDKSLTKFNVEAYRFGFINSEGVGYNLGVIAIIPYSSGGFGVTSFRKIEFAGVNPGYIYPDNDLIDRYGSDLRFNSINEGGVKLEIASTISLSAGYEYSVIYPRLMFWYWAGSEIIESAAEGCLNSFIHRIERSSPAAVPIVDMVLKNALSYGFYLLRKDKMNWPFETETPFTFETFKLGVTFTF